MTNEDRIAQLERSLEEANRRLEAVDPRPKRPEVVDVDVSLRKALERTGNDPDAAADLFYAWCQSSSEIRDSLKPLIREAIGRRLAEVKA